MFELLSIVLSILNFLSRWTGFLSIAAGILWSLTSATLQRDFAGMGPNGLALTGIFVGLFCLIVHVGCLWALKWTDNLAASEKHVAS